MKLTISGHVTGYIFCERCCSGHLSQTKHLCLLSDEELLEVYFWEIVSCVDENDVLRQWEECVNCTDIPEELVKFYKLKLYCKDWRDTDMKTSQWKDKMVKMCQQIEQLEKRF